MHRNAYKGQDIYNGSKGNYNKVICCVRSALYQDFQYKLCLMTVLLHRLEMSAVRYFRISCALRNEPLPTPALENAPKQYHPKIQQLVDQIASLTLLEVSDLNELLKVIEMLPPHLY